MKATPISRRQFLRGDIRGKRGGIRPPWSADENSFHALCTRCGDCIDACPEGILAKGTGGYPNVDFGRGECTFCGECAGACRSGALRSPQGKPWRLEAVIEEKCLAENGVVCRTCGEQCESGAIRFRLVAGGVARPNVEASACTGCGACYRPCPANAVVLRYHSAGEEMNHPVAMGASL